MEHSEDKKSSNEESIKRKKLSGKVSLNRRSSILKLPKVQNETQISCSTRRVSFSSNFIKAFTTDDDKNTIWDTTVEEILSATESSNSQNFKDSQSRDLDTTMLNDNNKHSLDENHKDCHLNKVKSKVLSHQDGNVTSKHIYEPSLIDTSAIMELTCTNLPVNQNTEELDVLDSSETTQLTCRNLPAKLNTFEQSTADGFEVMEFRCRNLPSNQNNRQPNILYTSTTSEFTRRSPILDQNISKPEILDTSATMEFTCVNPILISNAPKPSFADTSTNMEFTCRNPPLNPTISKPNILDTSATMEFTCANPILNSNGLKPSDGDTSTAMEFTCQNPPLNPTISKANILDSSATMEFTCANPILSSNVPKPSFANTSTNMEFTCRNPPLNPIILEPDILDASETMEFTCANPILDSNAPNPSDGDTSTTMEFTCQNPPLNPTISKPNISDTSATMEFTCANRSLKSSDPKPSCADISTNMEFTCGNPPLNPTISKPNILDTSATMEFTCAKPILYSNAPKQSDEDTSTVMEYTCQNPPINPTISKPIILDTSATMEFTCAKPILNSNTPKPIRIDTSATMEFTCRNPPLNPTISKPNILDTSATMEFACAKPILNSNTPKPILIDTSATMEFTCRNPPPNPNISKPIAVDTSATMEFTCRNPPLNQIISKPNILDASVTMEFTCANPILNSNGPKPSDGDTSTTMEFTCQNPPLNPNTPKPNVFDSSATMGLTGENATLNPKILKPNVVDTSATLELTCANPPLNSNFLDTNLSDTSKPSHLENSSTMEFISAGLNSFKPGLDTLAVIEFTGRNLTINENSSQLSLAKNSATLDFTCTNSSTSDFMEAEEFCATKGLEHNQNIKLHHKEENNIGTKLDKAPMQQELYNLANESHTAEFPMRNYLNKTNISNISALDISKGISLIQGSTQRHNDMSIAVDKGPIVDLPSFDLTIPEIIVTEFSTKQPQAISADVGNSTAVDLPSPSFTDVKNTKIKMKDYSTHSIPTISLPTGKVKDEDLSLLNLINVENTALGQSNITQIDNSNSLLKSNINLSVSSLCNVDDTQQLLIDASKLSRTRTIASIDNSVENTSGTQMNKTYLVENKKVKLNPKGEEEQDDEKRLEYTYKNELNSYDCKNTQNEELECDSHEENGHMDVEQLEEHTDLLTKCAAEFSKDNCIIDSTIELISADEISELTSNDTKYPPNLTNNFGVEENIQIHRRKSSEYSKNIEKFATNFQDPQKNALKKGFTASEFMALRRQDMMNMERKMDALTFISEKNDEFQNQMARIRELKKKSEQIEKMTMSRYEVFKKQLDIVNEFCQNNQLMPEEHTEEEQPGENDDFESGILTTIKGMFRKIEEKSKMCDNSWKMIKLEDGVAVFITYFHQLEVTLDYSPHDYIVSKIKTKSLLTDKAKPIGFLMQKELLRLLTPSHISKSIGDHYNILSLLDYIQMIMDKIRKCYTDLKELQKKYDLKLTYEYKAKFSVLNVYLAIKWDFTVHLSDLENITKDSISVTTDIGEVDSKPVLDLVSECPKGLEFLHSYVVHVEQYIESLMKRDRQLKSRKC